MGFAREALAQLVAEYDRVGDRRVRRRGRQPLRGAAGRRGPSRGAMVLHGLRSRRGYRRRGFRPNPARLTTDCGQVAFRSHQLGCKACERRFRSATELLGLSPHERRTERFSAPARRRWPVSSATPTRPGTKRNWPVLQWRPAASPGSDQRRYLVKVTSDGGSAPVTRLSLCASDRPLGPRRGLDLTPEPSPNTPN